ncbi:hypothetical protein AAHA92_32801 [Salvia divinorum]|uniref:Uncharacterized protein n=1 Tax=Salvia divinorum TaxID=28513 RepID=A0ABD1FP40_SALDI
MNLLTHNHAHALGIFERLIIEWLFASWFPILRSILLNSTILSYFILDILCFFLPLITKKPITSAESMQSLLALFCS